jgi:hypothetical protein
MSNRRQARKFFKVTTEYLNTMYKKYKKKLTCIGCGKEFVEGDWVLSKVRSGGSSGIKKTKRYCNSCRKLYKIWLPNE